MRALAVRLWSPTGLALAALLFLTPFLTVRCGSDDGSIAYTFSGVDLVTGARGDLVVRQDQDGDRATVETVLSEREYAAPTGEAGQLTPPTVAVPAQPFAVFAVVCLAVGLAGALVRRADPRALVVGGAAALAAAALGVAGLLGHAALAGRVAEVQRDYVERPLTAGDPDGFVHYEAGFVGALGVLLVVAAVNLARRPGGRLVHREHTDDHRDVPAP